MQTIDTNIELLAPAGSPETLIAAIQAGADAVYLGVKDFNARKRAKNFTLDELTYAVHYAHQHNKKVYLTLNTLVYDDEFDSIIEILNIAQQSTIDAIIVQDLGLIHLIHTYYPTLKIHASTQTFCHNSLHAEFLKTLGVSRIILPRELSLDEITTITQNVTLEYEVFIHGAMCFSFSGCCLFSSYLFGQSGNRGRCLQPCRYPFRTGDTLQYPFSMKDLAVGNSIKEYLKAGITNFKIEGRLRNTWYVQNVVAYYRKLIDLALEGKEVNENPPVLRSSSKGYMFDSSYQKLVENKVPGSTGTLIGTVTQITKSYCKIALNSPIRKGLRLRIIDSKGNKVYEGTLLDYIHNKQNNTLKWRISLKGDMPLCVYQIGESKESSNRKYFKAVPFKPYRASIHVDITDVIAIHATIQSFSNTYSFKVPAQKPLQHELNEDVIIKIFHQTSQYPFEPVVSVTIKDAIFIPLSFLKQIRREFYDKLYTDYVYFCQQKNQIKKNTIMEYIITIQKNSTSKATKSFDFDIIHFDRLHNHSIGTKTFIELPLFVPEAALPDTLQQIESLIKKGFNRFVIPTYGWLQYFNNKTVILCAGEYCYVVNYFTYSMYKNYRVDYFLLSEDMKDQKIITKQYDGYIHLKRPYVYMATRLKIPDTKYQHKGKTFYPAHFKHYDILTDG